MATRAAQERKEMIQAEALARRLGADVEDCYNFLNPDSEENTIDFIKTYLRTEEQRNWLHEQDLTLADILNGRFNGRQESRVKAIQAEWNEKLGQKVFGF